MLKSVAVIGGGFGGLAISNYVASYTKSLTVFQNNNSASTVAAGLMHPLSPQGKIIWKGLEGYEESMGMFMECQKLMNNHIVEPKRLFRPIYSDKDLTNFRKLSIEQPELVEMIQTQNLEDILQLSLPQAISACWIKKAVVVNPTQYLSGLRLNIQNKIEDVKFVTSVVGSDDLEVIRREFDLVFIAAGAGMKHLWGSESEQACPFQFVKGRNILYPQTSCEATIDSAVLSGEYVVPLNGVLVCGATHEHSFDENYTPIPHEDLAFAKSQLDDKLDRIYPGLLGRQAIGVNSGTRCVSPRTHVGRIPILHQSTKSENVWLCGGFGSRGLIHHALAAKILVDAAVNNDCSRIPVEMRLSGPL